MVPFIAGVRTQQNSTLSPYQVMLRTLFCRLLRPLKSNRRGLPLCWALGLIAVKGLLMKSLSGVCAGCPPFQQLVTLLSSNWFLSSPAARCPPLQQLVTLISSSSSSSPAAHYPPLQHWLPSSPAAHYSPLHQLVTILSSSWLLSSPAAG